MVPGNGGNSRFWRGAERFETVVQILAALAFLIPLVFAVVAFDVEHMVRAVMAAQVPAWTILPTAVVGICLGYALRSRRHLAHHQQRTPGADSELISTIRFDYDDSPTEHGWTLGQGKELVTPTFSHPKDARVGRTLEITAAGNYAMDYTVAEDGQRANAVEIIAHMGPSSVFYTSVEVGGGDGTTTRQVWLSFLVGWQQPRRVGDDRDEWTIPFAPVSDGQSWQVYRINLRDAVAKTFGIDGWTYVGLRAFRVRGNLSLASISLLG